jgi:tRNA pseudouridine38-40 synthase
MLTVAYDGTTYCGWQQQPNGCTIEQVLRDKLTLLFSQEIKLIGASRTDSGVHALGNVAVFDVETRIPAEKVAFALNQRLPAAIVVQDSREVPPDFHPRRCKSQKTYEYRILNRRFPQPMLNRDTFFYHHLLDEQQMAEAARYFIGRHDFRSFCSVHTAVTDFVREISHCSVKREDEIIQIRICGNGFLYNMVRIIAGTLIQVGSGALSPASIPYILQKKDRSQAGPTAPAHGLTLMAIHFEQEELWNENRYR